MRGLRRGLATLPPRNPGALSGQRAGWRPQEDLLNSTEISLCDWDARVPIVNLWRKITGHTWLVIGGRTTACLLVGCYQADVEPWWCQPLRFRRNYYAIWILTTLLCLRRPHTPFFQVNLGKPVVPLILLLHLFLDCTSFWDRPKLSMSFLTQSHQVFFGHPLCLIPSTSYVIQRLTQSLSSFRATCPNHLNLLFLIIKLTGSNPKSSLSSSLFFLSFSLTLHIHLIILISVRFIFNHTLLSYARSHCHAPDNSSHK